MIGYHVIGPSLARLEFSGCAHSLRTQQPPTWLSVCSYPSIHVACLFCTTSHSPLLFACDRVSRNRPITRTARVLRLRTFIEDSTAPSLSACSYPSIHVAVDSTASSLSACSYQSIHVACLFYTTHSRRFCLLVIGYHAIGPSPHGLCSQDVRLH